MSVVAVALVLASVILHVLWNTIAKGRPSFAFFFVGNLFGALALTPILFFNATRLGAVLNLIWPILLATGVAQAVYGLSLARAYREEDLSIVYPLVRSLGPAFVVLGSIALGRGDAIALACIVGVIAIFVGSSALGISNLRALGKRTLPSAGVGFSAVAALGTAGYTLLDDVGVRLILESGDLDTLAWARLRAGLLYSSLGGWATVLGMGLWIMRRRVHREAVRAYTSPMALRDAAFMGIGSYASYTLVVIAMLYVDDVSYVAGFRQLSIPFGAAVGVLWLGEGLDASKLFGLSAMSIGLLLIAFA
jgi:drug/metabolite transporter (DMT)-like permease